MMRIMCALMVFAALSLSNDASGGPAGAGSPPAGITEFPRTLTPAETQAVRASNDFGPKAARRLYAERRDRRANVFISPLSASMSTGAAFPQLPGTLSSRPTGRFCSPSANGCMV